MKRAWINIPQHKGRILRYAKQLYPEHAQANLDVEVCDTPEFGWVARVLVVEPNRVIDPSKVTIVPWQRSKDVPVQNIVRASDGEGAASYAIHDLFAVLYDEMIEKEGKC